MDTHERNPSPAPNLSGELFQELKERIIRWKYMPGYRLTEEALCTEFGVSRSPVREALRMLVENGLVEKEPHRGYKVRQFDIQEILQSYEVRLALELFVVSKLAISGMNPAEWQMLRSVWQALLEKNSTSGAEFPDADEAFHEALAQATGNQVLIQTLHGINERLHFIRINDITSPDRLRRTCEHHLKILDSIQNRQLAQAQDALRQNIQDGMANVEQALKEALMRAYLDGG